MHSAFILDAAEWAITGGLALWLGASFFAQANDTRTVRYDVLGLLPDFRFFAPRPVSRDICAYVRLIGEDGGTSPWRPLLPSAKPWWCFAWNPGHRRRKALFDLYRELDALRTGGRVWHVSAPYLTLLNVAAATCKTIPEAAAVQFMVACYAGYEEEIHDILFLSHVHALDR